MNDREAYEYYLDPAHLESTGPARKHPKDELTKLLSARISPSLLGQVAAAASAEDRPVGAWIRRALRNELERSGWKGAERRRRETQREAGTFMGIKLIVDEDQEPGTATLVGADGQRITMTGIGTETEPPATP